MILLALGDYSRQGSNDLSVFILSERIESFGADSTS